MDWIRFLRFSSNFVNLLKIKPKMKYLSLFALAILFSACSNPDKPTAVKSYSIEQLYNNKAINGAGFNADETKVLVHDNSTGIFNIYEINIADTASKPLTHSIKDSYFSIGYVPGTNNFLYRADQGGNENSHIYLQKADGSAVKDLTPWANTANSPNGWSTDKEFLYITSNRRDPKFNDIYKLDVNTWKDELLYQNDGGYSPGPVSKSERYIALTKSITTDKNELYIYDRTTKTVKKISNDKEATWYPAAFTKADSSLYYITNDGGEFSYLVKYNLNTGATSKVYSTNWDVVGMELSDLEKYYTVYVNADGKTKVLLFDNNTGKQLDFPEVKDGEVKSAVFSPSEKNIMLTVGSSVGPNNLYVYNFQKKELKPITRTLNPAVSTDDLVSAEVVHFKSFDGLEIPAIYYKPKNATKEHPVPAVLWIHGGPGGQSNTGFSNLIQFLVNHGYAVLAVNNRGSSGYGKTFYKLDNKDHSNGDLKDCIWGKKWLQQQAYIDTAKIGIMGGSYGGCMVLGALAFHPNEFKVGVDLFGVANWMRTLKSIPPYWEAQRKALYDELGNPYTADSVHLKKISPLFHYQTINKPLIVFQGMNDVRVLPIESKEIVEGVKKNGIRVEYITYPNEGHGFLKKENLVTTANKTLAFLDKYLMEKK
ncbi:MAG: secreted prolyl oligopeptidase family protein [Mucilaginibacter sp.]|nr:secreted prolyl oligopeptidase family protein [Mucilaginibacter sp.]